MSIRSWTLLGVSTLVGSLVAILVSLNTELSFGLCIIRYFPAIRLAADGPTTRLRPGHEYPPPTSTAPTSNERIQTRRILGRDDGSSRYVHASSIWADGGTRRWEWDGVRTRWERERSGWIGTGDG